MSAARAHLFVSAVSAVSIASGVLVAACAGQPPPPTVELVADRPIVGIDGGVDGSSDASDRSDGGTYSGSASAQFALGEDALKRNDFVTAERLFREVKEHYPYSRYAVLAEVRFGDIAMLRGDTVTAAGIYRQWLHDHRSNQDLIKEVRVKLGDAEKPPAR